MKIDRIFILTLPQSKARLDKLTALLNLFGLEYEVFYGVQGKDIKFKYECDNLNNACTASHGQIIQRAKIMGLQNCLILEDDCDLCDDFQQRLENLQLPNIWDVCYLSGSHKETPVRVSEGIYKCSWTLTTHAYIINLTMIGSKVLQNLLLGNTMDTPFRQPVDCYFVDMQKERFNFFVTDPPMAWQRGGYSEIQQREMNYPWLKDRIE